MKLVQPLYQCNVTKTFYPPWCVLLLILSTNGWLRVQVYWRNKLKVHVWSTTLGWQQQTSELAACWIACVCHVWAYAYRLEAVQVEMLISKSTYWSRSSAYYRLARCCCSCWWWWWQRLDQYLTLCAGWINLAAYWRQSHPPRLYCCSCVLTRARHIINLTIAYQAACNHSRFAASLSIQIKQCGTILCTCSGKCCCANVWSSNCLL